MFQIIPQTVTIKGELTETLVKEISFFPKTENKEVVGFGKIPSQNRNLQVILTNTKWQGKSWKLKYNPSKKVFTIVYGEQMDWVNPFCKDWNGSERTKKIVNKDGYMNTIQFMICLQQRGVDENLIVEILQLFNSK
jgi:hypothetical protein